MPDGALAIDILNDRLQWHDTGSPIDREFTLIARACVHCQGNFDNNMEAFASAEKLSNTIASMTTVKPLANWYGVVVIDDAADGNENLKCLPTKGYEVHVRMLFDTGTSKINEAQSFVLERFSEIMRNSPSGTVQACRYILWIAEKPLEQVEIISWRMYKMDESGEFIPPRDPRNLPVNQERERN